MKRGLVYQATSPDGQIYIGQTSRSLKDRRQEHEKCSGTALFARTLRECGTRNFQWQVLEDNIELSNLDLRENYYIRTLNPQLNVQLGRRTSNRAYSFFHKPKMLMARIPEDLFFQLKVKLKENNINTQTFVNALVKSVNCGLIGVKF